MPRVPFEAFINPPKLLDCLACDKMLPAGWFKTQNKDVCKECLPDINYKDMSRDVVNYMRTKGGNYGLHRLVEAWGIQKGCCITCESKIVGGFRALSQASHTTTGDGGRVSLVCTECFDIHSSHYKGSAPYPGLPKHKAQMGHKEWKAYRTYLQGIKYAEGIQRTKLLAKR